MTERDQAIEVAIEALAGLMDADPAAHFANAAAVVDALAASGDLPLGATDSSTSSEGPDRQRHVLRFTVPPEWERGFPGPGDGFSCPVDGGQAFMDLGDVLAVMWGPETEVRTIEVLLNPDVVVRPDVHPE